MLIEEALEDQASPYFDGFTGSRNAFFDLAAVEHESIIPSRWTRLWKIHGSINWRANFAQDGSLKSVTRGDVLDDGQKYLIYPSHLKYEQSRKMPYLALMDRLRSFLMSHGAVLVTTGYSFGDEHINDLIMSGLNNNPSAVVYGLLFDEIDSPPYSNALKCAKDAPNLVIMAKNSAIIGRRRADWRYKKITDASGLIDSLIHCTEEETEENEGHVKCEVAIGNFAKLGVLLRSMTSLAPRAELSE